jgi:hypothetical protein
MNGGEPAGLLPRRERKKIARLQRRGQEDTPDSRLRRNLNRILTLISYAVGFVGAAAAILSFLPAFSVSKDEPLDPHDPFSVPFIIEYDGGIPVRDVFRACQLENVAYEAGNSVNASKTTFAHFTSMWHGDGATVPCRNMFKFNQAITKADIYLQVEYRPMLLPSWIDRWWRPWKKRFHYITARQSDGDLRWLRELNSN